MSGIISTEDLNNLKSFVNLCKAKPEILNFPDLSFFKQFIESFGGKVPQVSPTAPKDFPSQKPTEPKETEKNVPEEKEESESEPESELEFDLEGCVDPDEIQPEQKMGDENKIPTEEECDQADEKRAEAMEQFSNGNFEKAIELYTEAIELNPTSALFYSKRGQAYLKLMKPKACIKDCDRALELNPDSAAAYKFRGRAYRLIAEWEKAAKDLRQACKIDFDEQTDEWLREVTPNAQKIEQHNMKRERKRAEKELKQKQERVRKAREANAKASASTNPTASSEPSGPGGPNASDFYNFVDPEIIEAFKDPDVAAAFEDISANPANFIKYQSNPKISAVINKLAEKIKGSNLGGMGGFPGMGGMGGFPGAGSGPGGFPGAGSGPGGFPGAGSGPGGFPGAGTNPGPAGDDVGLD